MSILTPFDEPTQKLLKELDTACAAQIELLREEARKASLSGDKELQVDLETLVWSRFIRGYGILYNRAIDAGWIQDIHLEGDK